MATPRSITVVRAGLSGAFDETFPQISSSGTYNHQGMLPLAALKRTWGIVG